MNIINVNNITNSTGNRSKPSICLNDLFSNLIERQYTACGLDQIHH